MSLIVVLKYTVLSSVSITFLGVCSIHSNSSRT
jgi:hypothetical protein